MRKKNLVCTSIDDNYLWPWMVMVYSAALNSDEKNFRIIIANMNGMLSKASSTIAKKYTQSLDLNLEIININTSLNPKFEHQFNLTVYSRLFLIDNLEQDFVWFDADLLLMPGWDAIFVESDNQGKSKSLIAGVLDSKLTLEKLSIDQNQAYIRTDGRYINAGVIKIWTEKWKKLHKGANWEHMANNLKSYGLSLNDQDIINYLCADRINLMSPGFNYIIGDGISIQEHIFIKHYAGFPKPWTLDRRGKEFLLAVQGAKYFTQRDWITQSADAFLHYPMYWQVEDQLLEYLQDLDSDLCLAVLEIRNRNLIKLKGISRLKHYLIQFTSRRFLS
jgi:lipopolysaccharide biosynthesis glycosyltransferase